MASFNCYVTATGRALIATAEAAASVINFVSVGTGSGVLTLGQDPTTLTNLINLIDSWPIDGSNALTPYQVTVQFTVNSASVSTVYANTEVGLFARIGSSGPLTLLWYANTTTPDTLTPSGTSNATVDINQLAIVFTDATTCIATQTPTVTVPPHAVTHITGGFDPIPSASSISDGLTPITPGDVSQVLLGGPTAAFGPVPVATAFKKGGMPITPSDAGQVALGGAIAAWGPVPVATGSRTGGTLALPNTVTQVWCGNGSWNPALLFLVANITLYVTVSGNNSTGTPNNPSLPFATLAGALTWLASYFIPPQYTATILLAAGTYTSSAAISINHPNAQSIQIIGPTNTPANITAKGSLASASGGWNVPWTVSSTANMSAGGWVFVNATTVISNQAQDALNGVFQITSVSGSVVTVFVPITLSGLAGSSFAGITAGTITPLTAILAFTGNTNGISIVAPGVNLIQGLMLVGPGSSNNQAGINISGGASVNLVSVAVTAFANVAFETIGSAGIFCNAGSIVNLLNCSANANLGDGLFSLGSIVANNCYFSYNKGNACGASIWGPCQWTGGGFCGNTHSGVLVAYAGYFICNSATALYNWDWGFECNAHATMSLNGIQATSNSQTPGNSDIVAEGNGYIFLTLSAYGTINPAVNTTGSNQNSYIYSF